MLHTVCFKQLSHFRVIRRQRDTRLENGTVQLEAGLTVTVTHDPHLTKPVNLR